MFFFEKKPKKSLYYRFLEYFFFHKLSQKIQKKLLRKPKRTSVETLNLSDIIINKPSHKGKMTGYEPYRLKNVELRNHTLMIGTPGSGLSQSNFDSKSVQLGQTGELNFAKILQEEQILDKLLSFWSVHNLDLNGKKTEADVDCILVSSKTIWLIDLKYYTSGDVTYKSDDRHFYTIDNQTGFQVKKPKIMTRNMAYADESFRAKFKTLTRYFEVKSRVVLVPTNNGSGRIDNVFWPGKIKAVTLEEILLELHSEPDFQDTIGGQHIKQIFNLLVKR